MLPSFAVKDRILFEWFSLLFSTQLCSLFSIRCTVLRPVCPLPFNPIKQPYPLRSTRAILGCPVGGAVIQNKLNIRYVRAKISLSFMTIYLVLSLWMLVSRPMTSQRHRQKLAPLFPSLSSKKLFLVFIANFNQFNCTLVSLNFDI